MDPKKECLEKWFLLVSRGSQQNKDKKHRFHYMTIATTINHCRIKNGLRVYHLGLDLDLIDLCSK